jgi:SAM-dependent methyltransferase
VRCMACSKTFAVRNGALLFNEIPDDIIPSNLPRRKPGSGTYWRRQNWAFLERAAREISTQQVVLDIGAGTGDFKPLFEDMLYLSADFYPYDDLDFVCDLTTYWPIKQASIDVVLCTNMLEHISEGEPFMRNIFSSLKLGGLLLITTPFMVKIHQAPYDFIRYTHFALEKYLEKVGFEVMALDAVYEPRYLANAMLKNLYNSIPQDWRGKNIVARHIVRAMGWLMSVLARLSPTYQPLGIVGGLGLDSNPYPIGYHIACRRA